MRLPRAWPPVPLPPTGDNGVPVSAEPSLRDRFAMAAMRGLLSTQYPTSLSFIAQQAYRLADEMMKARGNDSPP